MADHYDQLTDAEKCHWNAYTRLRELSDWEAFTETQDAERGAARDWLVAQRKFIWRCAEGKETPEYKSGWNINQRSERYAQLKDDSLNAGSPRNLCQLPTGAGTPSEKCMISEREMWWNQASVDEETKSWRQHNADVLTARRKQVWHLGEDEGWDESEREHRYDNLCVATKTGSAYTEWTKTHDESTGAEKQDQGGGSSSRATAVSNARKYLGVSENPPDSNRGSPQPDGWENRVYGSSGVPWCACFSTCMAWDAGVVGSSSAGVQQIVDMAKAGQGMFRGWTTDVSQVLRGDFVIIGCSSCHVGMCVESGTRHTIEGNTSPGTEGSQYNGGCVAEKTRSAGEVVGYALVDYP